MFDGAYQSAIAFFFVYEIFAPATFSSSNGLDLSEYRRMGVYAATTAVCAANIYVLYNTYRWDWLMVTIVVVSTLLIWIWTGIFTSFIGSAQFYKAASEVYGNLNFWAYVFMTIVVCLIPRFVFKSAQKLFFPIDADIIREQVSQGKFDYLKEGISPSAEKATPIPEPDATKYKAANAAATDEDVRPIYPPSVVTTHNPRSANGSNSTDFTFRRSMEGLPPAPRISIEDRVESTQQRPEHRIRPSFDRARMSMDPMRPSFEQSHDITSAAMLTRLESANSRHSYIHNADPQAQGNTNPMSKLRNALRRATITREEQPQDLDVPPAPKSPPASPKR